MIVIVLAVATGVFVPGNGADSPYSIFATQKGQCFTAIVNPPGAFQQPQEPRDVHFGPAGVDGRSNAVLVLPELL
ncbi:hypothetical protein VSH64_24550 [Amycolatopsis rhabdoformis]|uniref:Uncharacterized protein n=1 Tax=Amycolatopsis rhabdoformis TaxID=1448059 RepID=A0ABZ1HUI4_9PSEU|nr:hypothetical protein [Amycolatopsis rhabdoformis]WSE26052.1 hypothetical protein VSH64_24550 [Amycolatopsis rhabdoformis]